ncbi:MAG: YkgJ family cysteine cluster protein [Candidatus Omnitrophica bacterium]|nr:YkgJ family cysteine cluster protein [Candidatus Omnitrophota bacterium]
MSSFSPTALDGKISSVKEIFQKLDCDIAHFRRVAKFSCTARCSHCCENHEVEATELEMLPLARELVRLGQAEEWYKKAELQSFSGVCVFYDPLKTDPGACAQYLFRPLVCRLFGFAANPDKYGKARMIACSLIKKNDAKYFEDAEELIARGKAYPPLMSAYMMPLALIDPEMTRERHVINKAFKKARERLWLYEKFEC